MNRYNHILFNISAVLLIAAIFLCVFFGNGTHIHAVFDHIFDHGDIHILVHSHSDAPSQDHDHTSEFDDINTHNHPTATVDLTGTMIHNTTNISFGNTDIFSSSGVSSSHSISETPNPLFLDLPPPDDLYQSRYFSSYSLRGPPLG